MTKKSIKQVANRRKLFDDIVGNTPMADEFRGQPVEMNARMIVDLCFQDITFSTWCQAVGIKYKLNYTPDPEFGCPTTIIFTPMPAVEILEECDDHVL